MLGDAPLARTEQRSCTESLVIVMPDRSVPLPATADETKVIEEANGSR